MKYFAYICGSLIAAALVGALLNGAVLMVIVATVAWIAFGISKIPYRLARVLLSACVVLLIIIGFYQGWFTNHMPLTKSVLRTVPERVDVTLANAALDLGVRQEKAIVVLRQDLDSIHNETFQRALGMLEESVRRGFITADSALKILNDSLEPSLGQYEAAQAVQMFRSTLQGQPSNVTYLQVDVTQENGVKYNIPDGMEAHISVDSAWYTCRPSYVAPGDNLWTKADGYRLAPRKSTSRAGAIEEFVNPDESMYCLLLQDDQNPDGKRLGMGQVFVLEGSQTVTFVVNDWRGSWGSGEEYARGGFFDNQGYIRVRIALQPKI